MKWNRYFFISSFSAAVLLLTLAASPVFSQRINRIEGFVYGLERRPLVDFYVELEDDLGRTMARVKTNSMGSFGFPGLSEGNYTVRVLTSGTDYEEREERVEIFNITPTAVDNKHLTIYLRLKRGVIPTNVAAATVFAQDVPPEAKKAFDKAIVDLAGKREAEGLAGLRTAIELFPTYHAALERLGLEYIQIGKTETLHAAEVLLSLAIETYPRGFKSWYGLALARHSLDKDPAALEAIEKAVELMPSSADALFLYGRLLRRAKRYSDAEKQLVKAKESSLAPSAQLHWELALLYGNNLMKYAEAAKELTQYLKINPTAANAEGVKKLIADFERKAATK